ncbi:MAG: transaldolase [Chloroflexi bacterium]|nr:transaldolase [Chloroflexota bacterium]
MDEIAKIHALGQSIWYDNIQRRLLQNGEFARMIQAGDIRGVTSNPSIFHNAIAKSSDYDAALLPLARSGMQPEQVFTALAVEDIQAAADLFLPLYTETGGEDGFVSLEVSPYLAHDTAATLAEARRLWELVHRPNLMVKIPATPEGIPAIKMAIASGININVTLIFSLNRYAEVMDAYLSGLEQRLDEHFPIERIASVASFFVSRLDTKVDARLKEIGEKDPSLAGRVIPLAGKAAIANARLAYAQFQKILSSERLRKLQKQGARLQRPLWASTSTKNQAYRDVVYVEELIGPDTVNTVPPQTLDAFRDHGKVQLTLTENLPEARQVMRDLDELGISMTEITQTLEDEGVKAFADAMTALLEAIAERKAQAVAEGGNHL